MKNSISRESYSIFNISGRPAPPSAAYPQAFVYLLEQMWVSAHWEAAQQDRYLASWCPRSTSVSAMRPSLQYK